MTSTGLAALPTAPAASRAAAPGATAGPTAPAHADPIARAKHDWLQACAEGAPSARVQRLYEDYRTLVINQVAAIVQGRSTHLS